MTAPKLIALVLLIVLANEARADGERFALCIGVNNYDNKSVAPLASAEGDVAGLADILRTAGYRVVLMTSSSAKIDPALAPRKANIEKQLTALVKDRKPDDSVLVAFSLRTIRRDMGRKTLLCPADARPDAGSEESMISLDVIYQRLASCRVGSKLILADCRWDDPSKTGVLDGARLIPPGGVTAFFSCAADQNSLELVDLKQGVFYHHILETLKGETGKPKASLSLKDLADHTTVGMTATVKRCFAKGVVQTPCLLGGLTADASTVLTVADRRIIAEAVDFEKRKKTIGGLVLWKDVNPDKVQGWRAAAERGSTWSMVIYGRTLQEGPFEKADPAKAVEWFRKAADRGEARGMTCLGYSYLTGSGVDADSKRAFDWFQKAADLGEIDGMCFLGSCYEKGISVKKDRAKALKCYEAAAASGYTDAIHKLADCYRTYDEVMDKTKALELFRKAALLGNPSAMYNLGVGYDEGCGVERDQAKAFEWYSKAAEFEIPEALSEIGRYHFEGMVVKKDAGKAFAYFRKAANLGDRAGTRYLGFCYFDGIGVAKDLGTAVEWYSKAVDLGDSTAMLELARCYRDGLGVKKDLVKAYDLSRRAADLGDAVAITCVGVSYRNGVGVKQDVIEAVKWFRKAADLGESLAMYHLGECYHEGYGVTKDPTEAAKWFRKGADKDNAECAYSLGACYFHGAGVKRDDSEAVKWLRKAAKLGSENAKRALELLGEK